MLQCTAGKTIPCRPATYNNQTNADLATACTECPRHAISPEGSTSIRDCVCMERFYDDSPPGSSASCMPCFAGTACELGVVGLTIATLPIKRGYFRTSSTSIDVG